jgi:ATP-dependent DNA helicase RecQ
VRHFGFMQMREGQAETIAAALRGESILTVMPTGAGKSVCYQLPALVKPRATLIISPLIALMKDQVESLPTTARKQATFINSTLSDDELRERMAGIAAGDYKLVYAAPERLRQRGFLHALRAAGLDLFVVDEAHCVSLWGHDFRPDYLFIQEARAELGNPPALAMTATAPPRVRDEIVEYMSDTGSLAAADAEDTGPKRGRPHVLALDIFRDNLHLSALRFHNEEEKLAALTKFVSETDGSGIIYVNSRHRAESLAFHLREAGVAAEAYHAGIANRGAVQDRFMSDKTRVVVATIAFGMGIDKADIRFIVHFHPSRSLAAYYQEVGRAGRDGKPSQGVLFYSNNDWANLRRWAKSDEYSIEFLERVYVAVANQLDVKVNLSETTAPVPELDESVVGPVDARRLQQVLNADETTIRVAISFLERGDLLSRSFDMPREFTIGMPRKLPAQAEADRDFQRLLRGLALRTGKRATFSAGDIADFMGWPLHETESALIAMQDQGWLQVEGAKRVMLIELAPPSGDIRMRLERLLAQSAAIAQRRIDDVIGYATADTCRHGYISAHFGSPPRARCEVCDNCTGIRPDIPEPEPVDHLLPDDADIEPMILDCLVSLPKPVGRSGLARILTGSLRSPVKPNEARHHGRLKGLGEATVMNYIDDLLEDARLRQYTRSGYPVLAATVSGRAQATAWLEKHPDLAVYGEAPEEEEAPEPEKENAGDKYTTLQKALWAWRRRTAEEQGQPPYVIMSNQLMLTIAETRPADLDALAMLPGIGAQRLQHYGPVILDLINLNPAEEGDEALIAAQRTALNETANRIQDRPSVKIAAVSPQCERLIYLKLQELRQKEAVRQGSKPSLIANNTMLKSIAAAGPSSLDELQQIVGFRSSGLREAATQILAIVEAARQQADDEPPGDV